VRSLVIAPSAPNIVYLQVQDTIAGAADAVYASTNAGGTWERRSEPDAAAAIGMTVDPGDPESLWFPGHTLYYSPNGGRKRMPVPQVAHPAPMVDVARNPGGGPRIIAYEGETQSFAVSLDGGQNWGRIAGPGIFAHAIAHGPLIDDVIVAGHDGVYRFVAPKFWAQIHIEDQPDLFDLQASRSGPPLLFGLAREDNTLWRYETWSERVEIDPFVSLDSTNIDTTTELTPKEVKVKLDPGDTKTVPFELGLPAHPTPLDVFFLVDTSMSMDPAINGLREGMQKVIDELEGERIDVHFGVGEFKDYPIPGYGNPELGDFAYRLDRKIGPADAELADALEQLQAGGGGRLDEPESQLTGLYQAATGEGQPGFVPPGQDAGFRPGSLRVIINITDARFHDEPSHPSPPFDNVAVALRDRGIMQIGLSAWGEVGPKGTSDLIRMADETDARAPTPVDCNGDGTPDIPAGQPLVCEVGRDASEGALNLAPAIVSTLKAVTEKVAIGFEAQESSLVQSIEPSLYPDYNVIEAGNLNFDVTFVCPRQLEGTEERIDLQALVEGQPVAGSAAMVICRPLDPLERDEAEVPLAAIPALVVPVAPVVAPPPPPPPIAETAPSTQQMAQAQAAMAAQEQEQIQTAVAWQEAVKDQIASEYTEYEFSSLRRDPGVPEAWPLYAAAATMAMAAGAVASVRIRVRPRTARIRR
jgi:hypothetical protein